MASIRWVKKIEKEVIKENYKNIEIHAINNLFTSLNEMNLNSVNEVNQIINIVQNDDIESDKNKEDNMKNCDVNRI